MCLVAASAWIVPVPAFATYPEAAASMAAAAVPVSLAVPGTAQTFLAATPAYPAAEACPAAEARPPAEACPMAEACPLAEASILASAVGTALVASVPLVACQAADLLMDLLACRERVALEASAQPMASPVELACPWTASMMQLLPAEAPLLALLTLLPTAVAASRRFQMKAALETAAAPAVVASKSHSLVSAAATVLLPYFELRGEASS